MKAESSLWLRATQTLATALVCVLGLFGIVGSGGGVEGGNCSFFTNTCNPIIDLQQPVFSPGVAVSPARQTVQAGTIATFQAQAYFITAPTFTWQRSSDGGANFVDIAGATTRTLTLNPAQLADNGVVLRVTAKGTDGSASAMAVLTVSRYAALVFEDHEFLATDWSSQVSSEPAVGGPTTVATHSDSGGQPGAYWAMDFSLTAGPSVLRLYQVSRLAIYDPAQHGALASIDYSEDCIRLDSSKPSLRAELLLLQAGRQYVPALSTVCQQTIWLAMPKRLSLTAADFVQMDGPACGAAQACPDFSGAAPVLQLGFARRASNAAGNAAVNLRHGIDNWRVAVWR